MDQPRMRVTGVVLSSSDPRALAGFYQRMLGGTIAVDEPAQPGSPPEDGWVILRVPGGLPDLSFQYERDHVAPTWPQRPGAQQMMIHIDIAVDELEAAVAKAVAAGARLAEHQPQNDVRVMIDPAGHPFCLFFQTPFNF